MNFKNKISIFLLCFFILTSLIHTKDKLDINTFPIKTNLFNALKGPKGVAYYFPDVSFDSTITKPVDLLQFSLGSRPVSPAEIEAVLKHWAQESEKIKVFEYGRTYENRSLNYAVISSKTNLNQLNKIKADMKKISYPSKYSIREINRLIKNTPAIVWFAYNVHGNEASGSDAALAIIYKLLASKEQSIKDLLDKLVIVIDPSQNPDGRQRFIDSLRQYSGQMSNYDDQSATHRNARRINGRTNHFWFDLNRDYIYALHPETQGKLKALRDYHPIFYLDGHEMGSQSSFYFDPGPGPSNEHLAFTYQKWVNKFQQDNAQAFDKYGWAYFSKEIFDNFYPGYGSSWLVYSGGYAQLFEQAAISSDAIQKHSGKLEFYQESVNHFIVSTFSNLDRLKRDSKSLLRDYSRARRKAAASLNGAYPRQSIVIPVDENPSRIKELIRILKAQEIQYYALKRNQQVSAVKSSYGHSKNIFVLKKDSLVIPFQQENAHLVATLFEFDAKVDSKSLKLERHSLLKNNRSTIYDVTAWNLPLQMDIEAFLVSRKFRSSELTSFVMNPIKQSHIDVNKSYPAFIIDGFNDDSVVAANLLLNLNIRVRFASKPIFHKDSAFQKGSLIIHQSDQMMTYPKLIKHLNDVSDTTGVKVVPLKTAKAKNSSFDVMSRQFKLLVPSKVALIVNNPSSTYNAGALWHNLDQRLYANYSLLSEERLASFDLRRYNVIIYPSANNIPQSNKKVIESWVKNGGTLIAMGNSSKAFLGNQTFVKHIHLLSQSFSKMNDVRKVLAQKLNFKFDSLDVQDLSSGSIQTNPMTPIFSELQKASLSKEIQSKESFDYFLNYNKRFLPSGVFLAARSNSDHWLSSGKKEGIGSVFYSRNSPFVVTQTAASIVDLGYISKLEADTNSLAFKSYGWSILPKNTTSRLKLSGLLWPETHPILMNSSYLAQERIGKGQVILFAADPIFRGMTLGTIRMLNNAIIYGPGLGTKVDYKSVYRIETR